MFGKKKAQRDPTSYGDHDNENQDTTLNNSNDSFRGSSSDGNNNGSSSSDSRIPKKTITTVLLGAAALALAVSRYKICQPNQYLVRTGIGITNMSVSKKAVVWPLQKHVYVNMNPKTYTVSYYI